MIDFLTKSDMFLSLIFALLDLAMCFFPLYRGIRRKTPYVFEMSVIAFGLFFDAFICALSGLLSKEAINTKTFETISLFRFILHSALIPLLFPICGYAIPWKKKGLMITYIVTAIFIILGVLQGALTKLSLVTVGPITRYAMDKDATAKWVQEISRVITIFPIIPLLGRLISSSRVCSCLSSRQLGLPSRNSTSWSRWSVSFS